MNPRSSSSFATASTLGSRVVIDRVRPEIDAGHVPVKRALGESLEVNAVLVCDGHELLQGEALWRRMGSADWDAVPLESTGNDVYRARVNAHRMGLYEYTVQAEIDRWGTWVCQLKRRIEGGQRAELRSELEAGLILLEEGEWDITVLDAGARDRERRVLQALLRSSALDPAAVASWLGNADQAKVARALRDPRSRVRFARSLPFRVDSPLAGFSAWYEFFPRSTGAPGEHGTFDSAIERLEYAADLGFDVVYLPPIHPIGRVRRKGRNNSVEAEPGDVGSPWAIGSREGGHRTVHPALGGQAAWERFRRRAEELGVAVALDLAFQCAPDHPAVSEHPEWFLKRPDGSIRFAENPPKQYQDIYPFDFEGPGQVTLFAELRDTVLHWVRQGVTVFRVDNPHTKPIRFWEWLIADVQASHPETVFLAEAFTRPHVMEALAKAGFSQSYTYFTWRNTREEIESYLHELATTDRAEYFRPNLWPNTPDILPAVLQSGRRGAFIARAVLAATLSPNYGVYGPAFELMEASPLEEGGEEYRNSEKYELRSWSVERSDSLAPVLARLNRIRREQPALRSLRSLEFHPTTNRELIAYSKRDHESGAIVLTVVNLDPYHPQGGFIELPLDRWGIGEQASYGVRDLLGEGRHIWSGRRNFVELNPELMPAHVFLVDRSPATERGFEYFG